MIPSQPCEALIPTTSILSYTLKKSLIQERSSTVMMPSKIWRSFDEYFKSCLNPEPNPNELDPHKFAPVCLYLWCNSSSQHYAPKENRPIYSIGLICWNLLGLVRMVTRFRSVQRLVSPKLTHTQQCVMSALHTYASRYSNLNRNYL